MVQTRGTRQIDLAYKVCVTSDKPPIRVIECMGLQYFANRKRHA